MNNQELLNLNCGDIIQCKNHPKVKGKSVEIAEFDLDSPKDSINNSLKEGPGAEPRERKKHYNM